MQVKQFVQKGIRYFRTNKWMTAYVVILLLLLPLTVILAGQQQNKDTHAAAIPLAIDIQATKNQSTPAVTIVSPQFNTRAGNELVVVFLSSDGSTSSPQSFRSVSGGGLNFTFASRANSQRGTAEVWYAYSAGILTNMQITATRQNGSYTGLMRVMTFTGAQNVLGATIGGSGASGGPSVSLNTTVANSLVVAVGNDPTNALGRTVGSNQQLTQQFIASKAKRTYWIQQQATSLPTAGLLVNMNDTAPTTDAWNMVAIEVLPVPDQIVSVTPGQTLAGLVAGYSFDEGAGTVAGDSSGNGNSGSVSNGSWTNGKYANGLSFNGTNSSIMVNNSSLLDVSGNAMTVSMWIQPTAGGSDSVVLGKFWNTTMTPPYYQYGLELDGGTTPHFYIGTPGGAVGAKMGSALAMGQWSHLAVVFNGSQAQFYINGSLVSTQPLAATITARGNQLKLGADANNQQFYNGMLDEVEIYNRALTPNEVQTVMNSPLGSGSGNLPTATPTITKPTPTSSIGNPTPTSVPVSGAWPDASNTGVPAGTTLTVVNGNMSITTDNTVVDGKDIRGCVDVNATGVIIRNSKITCTSGLAVYSKDNIYSGSRVLIEDSELSCGNVGGTAIGEANITVVRANIHGCENGFDINRDITVQDSYIHDMYNSAAAHTDGIQFSGHCIHLPCEHDTDYILWALNITINHNTIYGMGVDGSGGTSAIISNHNGDTNILIQNNLMAGGAFTLYCEQDATGNNYRVLNNHFSTKFYPKVGDFGASTACSDETQSGNVIHETNQPINLE